MMTFSSITGAHKLEPNVESTKDQEISIEYDMSANEVSKFLTLCTNQKCLIPIRNFSGHGLVLWGPSYLYSALA